MLLSTKPIGRMGEGPCQRPGSSGDGEGLGQEVAAEDTRDEEGREEEGEDAAVGGGAIRRVVNVLHHRN